MPPVKMRGDGRMAKDPKKTFFRLLGGFQANRFANLPHRRRISLLTDASSNIFVYFSLHTGKFGHSNLLLILRTGCFLYHTISFSEMQTFVLLFFIFFSRIVLVFLKLYLKTKQNYGNMVFCEMNFHVVYMSEFTGGFPKWTF